MNRASSLFLCFVFLFIFNNPSFSEEVNGANGSTTFGLAGRSCSMVIADTQNPQLAEEYGNHQGGILTGFNIMRGLFTNTPSLVGSKTTYEYRNNWIKDYCEKNPQANFADAVAELFFYLVKNKL